jgi:hypothetical protein
VCSIDNVTEVTTDKARRRSAARGRIEDAVAHQDRVERAAVHDLIDGAELTAPHATADRARFAFGAQGTQRLEDWPEHVVRREERADAQVSARGASGANPIVQLNDPDVVNPQPPQTVIDGSAHRGGDDLEIRQLEAHLGRDDGPHAPSRRYFIVLDQCRIPQLLAGQRAVVVPGGAHARFAARRATRAGCFQRPTHLSLVFG